jgi:DNA-binding SARP family transcriptional activator
MGVARRQRVAVVGAKIRPPTVVALVRERVNRTLDRVWSHRLGLVVGPAGSGKTTALAQFVATAEAPVAWYRAEATEADPAALLSHLEAALVAALGVPGNWTTLEHAVAALERYRDGRALLVVDDLHELASSDAERLLEKLVGYAPPWLHVLAGSRTQPGFNTSRLRVSGELLEVGADDLRFRSWEVEQLFRGFYREPLPPEDLASLTRRTEGWAAGLQLFHLATIGKPAEERRRAVAALGTRSRLVRDYLARNVLHGLRAELRDFLVDTCVLGRLTGPLCDRLLERAGSRRLLEELGELQVLTVELDDEGTYRYHEVLRSHLEAVLVERVGEAGARERYRRAGELLEAAGALPEALHAWCRATDGHAVDRLLGLHGGELAGGARTWLDRLPPALLERDPWLLLAEARRQLAAGRLEAAAGCYRRAEAAFGDSTPVETCRRERQALGAWLEHAPGPAGGWTGMVRAAARDQPLAAREAIAGLPGPEGRLAEGLAGLLGGVPRVARTDLVAALEHPSATAPVALGARLALLVAELLAGGQLDQSAAERVVQQADRLELPWLTRVGRALLALRRGAAAGEAEELLQACDRDGDRWGAALVGLLQGLALPLGGTAPAAALDDAAARFQELGAGAPAALARSLAAACRARLGTADAGPAARQAAAGARAAGVPGAEGIALLALATVGLPEPGGRGEALAGACGIAWTPAAPSAPEPSGPGPSATNGRGPSAANGPAPGAPVPGGDGHAVAPPAAAVEVRCFGRFELLVGGRPVDLNGLKPRCQVLLRLLAMHGARPVHREALIEAIWPEAQAEAGMRNLQVAVSTLRRFLEPAVGLAREAHSYRLALPAGHAVDVLRFEEACAAARTARAAGDSAAAQAALQLALDAYRGELLPTDGPAEWVVAARDRYRAQAGEAAEALAELQLAGGAAARAAETCKRGLGIDRYRDPLWRLLATAHERGGDQAAAARARRGYEQMLQEMGLEAVSPAPAPARRT